MVIPLAAAFALLLAPSSVLAQDDCEAKLLQAEEKFTNARFDEAIALLTECLDKKAFTNPERQRVAYRLLGLSYLGKDYIEQAKNAINRLLDLMPLYKPDPDQDPPAYIQVFEMVKNERQQREAGAAAKEPAKEIKPKKGGSAKWLLIGGGVVVAGVGAAVALGGGSSNPPPVSPTPLPTPPPLP